MRGKAPPARSLSTAAVEQRGLAGSGDSRDEVERPEADAERRVDDRVTGETGEDEELVCRGRAAGAEASRPAPARGVSRGPRPAPRLPPEQPPSRRRVGAVRAEETGRRAARRAAVRPPPRGRGRGRRASRRSSASCGSWSTTTTVWPRSRSRRRTREEARDVARVQPGARLVEDDDEAAQLAEGEREEAQALRLAGREGRRGAVEGQVADAELVHQRAAREERRRGSARGPRPASATPERNR